MVNILDILTPDELWYKPSLEECLKKQKVWTRYIRLLTRMYDKAVQMDNELAAMAWEEKLENASYLLNGLNYHIESLKGY